jgi:hypothetical protein
MTRRRLAHAALTLTTIAAAAWAWHTWRCLRTELRLAEDEARYWFTYGEHFRQQTEQADRPRLRAVPTQCDALIRHINEVRHILRQQNGGAS